MKNTILTPLISFSFLLLLSANLLAICCPVCNEDTFDGQNCTNPSCELSHSSPLPNLSPLPSIDSVSSGGSIIAPAGLLSTASRLKAQVQQTPNGAGCIALTKPSATTYESDDLRAPQWLRSKSQQASRDGDDDSQVPDLDDFLTKAMSDSENYGMVEPTQTADEIQAFLNSYLNSANHGFIIQYSAADGVGGTVHQLLVVAVNRYRQIFVLSNVYDYWNVVTLVTASEIFDMIDVETFDPDTDHLVLYGYLGNINAPENIDRMDSIPEGNEEEDDAKAE